MGIAERKEREREERRRVIIDAAEKIFFEKSFDVATMQDIADHCELSKGTLYLYFKTKNELCLAIYSRSLTLLQQMFEKSIDEHISVENRIKDIVSCFHKFIKDYPALYQAILNFHQHSTNCSESADIITTCGHQKERISNLIVQMIESGKLSGEISAETDSQEVANLLWNDKTGILSCAKLIDKNGIDQNAFDSVNYFIKILLQAISKK